MDLRPGLILLSRTSSEEADPTICWFSQGPKVLARLPLFEHGVYQLCGAVTSSSEFNMEKPVFEIHRCLAPRAQCSSVDIASMGRSSGKDYIFCLETIYAY
ncbi:hypothetical protein FOXYSP1_01204 [Fusarium oxysporum f. sp. phaseoli]